MDQNNTLLLAAVGIGLLFLFRKVKNSVSGLFFKIVAIRNISTAGAEFVLEVHNNSGMPVPALSLSLSGIVLVGGVRVGTASGEMDSVIMPGGSALMPIFVNVDNSSIITAMIGLGIGVSNGNKIKVSFIGTTTIAGISFPLNIDSLV